MKYMIVECHTSYAVALDEDGRFLKVANMHYQVGQNVKEVVAMKEREAAAQPTKKNYKWMYVMVSAAACLLLMFTTIFTINNNSPYASIFMTINPEVRIDVNQKDKVVGLEGVNDDGKQLVANYTYKNKQLKVVMDELVDLAIEMGFLSDGDKITLEFDADDNDWVITHEDDISNSINDHLKNKMSVTIQIGGEGPINVEETVAVSPETSASQNIVIDTTYSNSDYETTGKEATTTKKAEKQTKKKTSKNDDKKDVDNKEEITTKKSSKKKNNKTDNKKNNQSETTKASTTTNNASNSGDSNYEATDDGDSNYDETGDTGSNYGDSNYGDSDDGSSNYDDASSDYD